MSEKKVRLTKYALVVVFADREDKYPFELEHYADVHAALRNGKSIIFVPRGHRGDTGNSVAVNIGRPTVIRAYIEEKGRFEIEYNSK